MNTHILPISRGFDPFDLALALILTPPSGDDVVLLGEHRDAQNHFVVTECTTDGEKVKNLEHLFITLDAKSVQITVQHEDEFPSSASCPRTLFDLAGPPRTNKAAMWRSVCLARRSLKPQPEPGWVLRFKDPVETAGGESEREFVFDPVRGCRGACFVSTQTGDRIAIPYFFDRAYEVAA